MQTIPASEVYRSRTQYETRKAKYYRECIVYRNCIQCNDQSLCGEDEGIVVKGLLTHFDLILICFGEWCLNCLEVRIGSSTEGYINKKGVA